MATIDFVQQAFAEAQRLFRSKLKDPNIYKQILATSNIKEVYGTTKKLQELAHGNGRHLQKIKPFLDCLEKYAGVIETFVQVKPEIMALIWGPLKLLLLWSSEVATAQDKFTNTLVELGHAMPHVELMGELYGANDMIKTAMGLLFEDILEFYRVNFDFFRKPYWKKMLGTLWDGHLQRLNDVIASIKQHSILLREGVTLADIKEARDNRIRSLNILEVTLKDQQRQKFSSLRDRLSSNLYDERLDWIRNRSVSGCGNWLLEDVAFCSWQDISKKIDQTPAWLWIRGIPGAGKTYLCGAVIDHLRKDDKKQTLIALLSYAYSMSQTALSILQSFIFQAAEDDPDFQSVLIDATERELRGNTGYVVDVLKTWLRTAGPTYIVIDGLDEMEISERQILLLKLEELSKESDDLRLLVCSRSEADICRALGEKAANIQVNERNSGSIQAYINSRTDEWIKRRRFDPDDELELRELLSPLSAKAKGMFLFARVIIDSVDKYSSMEEIRSELKALPNDLDDAYKRIFERINKLPNPHREKSRKVLGWIACAPIPMTTFEMEQALLIEPLAYKVSRVPTRIFRHDFLDMCGPFIEIVDGKLQFVHFTVQEYIFSNQITDFLDEINATQDLAQTFLAYLGSSILDLDVDDDQIFSDIMCGKYRLLQYAHFYLPALLQRLSHCFSSMPLVLGYLLDTLTTRYSNDDFTPMINSREPQFSKEPYRFNRRQYEFTRQILQFHLADKRWNWNRSNSEEWVNFDPLITSKMLVRFQNLFEELVSDKGKRKKMAESHYGSRLFKCTYLFCTYSRWGFETEHDKDVHVAHHEHQAGSNQPLILSADDLSKLSVVDAQPLLFALVMESDLENTQRLISSPSGKKLKPEVLASARFIAAKQSSLGIMKLLAPLNEADVPLKIVRAAMRSENAECAEWVITRANTSDWTKLMQVALAVESEEVYRIWEQHVINKIKCPELLQSLTFDPVDAIFRVDVFNDINGSILKETRLQHTLGRLKDNIGSYQLGTILVRIANSSCTLSLAKQLLSYGAPIDHPRQSGGLGMTALHAAAKNPNKDAALLIEHLTSRGSQFKGPSTSVSAWLDDSGNVFGMRAASQSPSVLSSKGKKAEKRLFASLSG